MNTCMAVVLGAAMGASAPDPTPGPVQTVKSLVETIRGFEADPGGGAGSIAEEDQRRRVQQAHAALDFEGLAQRALKGTYSKLTPETRKEFVALLKRVFEEVAYPQSARFFGKLQLEYAGPRERRGQKVVEVAVRHPDQGLVDLEFFLAPVDGSYRVQDLTLDGISLGRDIETQMQQIIRQDGYAALVKRMKAKLQE